MYRLWATYVSPTGRFVARWRFGFYFVTTDGTPREVCFLGREIWSDWAP